MKILSAEAIKVVAASGKVFNPLNMFLACSALLTCPSVHGEIYWAYVPKPPLIHPVT